MRYARGRSGRRVWVNCPAVATGKSAEWRLRDPSGLAGRSPVDDGFEPVTVRVTHEGGVVVRTVGRAQTGRAIAGAAVRERSRMEGIDRRARSCGQGDVKPRPRGDVGTGAVLQREHVALSGVPVADRLSWLAGPDVGPHADEPERGESRIVEAGGSFEVANAQRQVMQGGPHGHWVRVSARHPSAV